MNDLDMLYDYYISVNMAAGGYATIACHVKNDKLEKLFRKLTEQVLDDSRAASELIIKLGGKIY
ncbi:MAG: spore coat protein [Eubacteriales bacterium]